MFLRLLYQPVYLPTPFVGNVFFFDHRLRKHWETSRQMPQVCSSFDIITVNKIDFFSHCNFCREDVDFLFFKIIINMCDCQRKSELFVGKNKL